jgi:hypothetical protein
MHVQCFVCLKVWWGKAFKPCAEPEDIHIAMFQLPNTTIMLFGQAFIIM